MANISRHQKFVMTNVDNNNNKFWEIWEYDDGGIKTRWGRVSQKDKAQEKTFPPGKKSYDSYVKSKTKKGYREVSVVGSSSSAPASSKPLGGGGLESIAASQIAKGNKAVEGLVKFLARKNRHTITQNTSITYDESTGLYQTPLGVVTKSSIDSARDILAELRDYVEAQDHDNRSYKRKLEDYLMLIPSDTGRKRGWHRNFLPDIQSVEAQNSILDALQASLDILLTGKGKTKKGKRKEEKVFDVLVEPIEDPREIRRIEKKYKATRQRVHMASQFDVKKCYAVRIESMARAFEEHGLKIGNLKELWHGTQASNVLSILAKGMVIPPSSAAHCTGRMYGDGLYFSDQSTKSLNYAAGYWGGQSDRTCYMFLADVAMGKEYIPRGAFGGRCPKGYHSTFAKAGQSGVMNNEMIVYQRHQANITRLVEFG